MPTVPIKKLKSLANPRIHPTGHMLSDFTHQVLAIAQPDELASGGGGPDRLVAILAVEAVLHWRCVRDGGERGL